MNPGSQMVSSEKEKKTKHTWRLECYGTELLFYFCGLELKTLSFFWGGGVEGTLQDPEFDTNP